MTKVFISRILINFYNINHINFFTANNSSEAVARGGFRKNMIFWRKIVIFHTKYPKNVRASLRSAQSWIRPWLPHCLNGSYATGMHMLLVNKLIITRENGWWWWYRNRAQIFFRTTQELEYLFFLSRKARIFFPEFDIRLFDKNSESDYFFFPPPKSEYFFQQHWESEYFFRKKNITPLFKLNGRSLSVSILY